MTCASIETAIMTDMLNTCSIKYVKSWNSYCDCEMWNGMNYATQWFPISHCDRLFEKKIQYTHVGPAPNNFLQDLLKLCRTVIYKILKLNGIGDGNNKNLTRHVFKYKHTKWSHWCITASLTYKNTMINRITMEMAACLRSKCHLKQNLIPSWPWSFRHTSCISDFQCKTKYTNKKYCRTPGPAYLAVLPVLVIFYPLGLMNFKKSAVTSRWSSVWITSANKFVNKPVTLYL
jgi:hypothetical protein